MQSVTCSQYKYGQVTVELFYDTVTLIHCSVAVSIYVSPFFLYLKECVITLEFGSTVSCILTKETRITEHKAIA